MNKAKLIIADSERDPDMFYAAGILAPDDFICVIKNNKKTIYVSDLEFNRAIKESKADKVVNYSEYSSGVDTATFGGILTNILKSGKIKKVVVPGNFKMKYAEILSASGIDIEVKEPFFEEMIVKNEEEIKKIAAVQKSNEKALKQAIELIRRSKIRKDKKLSYQNKIVTSEFVREILHIEFSKENCFAELSTVVSCGKDSADPHKTGKGPLIAGQPIVIDAFPKSRASRYYGDITRTIVRGKASNEIKKMYASVLKAQKLAIEKIREGARADLIHKEVQNSFLSDGFKTGDKNGEVYGFFHSTGHGVGLNIHELPRISSNYKKSLRAGNAVTVEPGLYYPGIGGVRIEDMGVVTKTGFKNLTNFPKVLEI